MNRHRLVILAVAVATAIAAAVTGCGSGESTIGPTSGAERSTTTFSTTVGSTGDGPIPDSAAIEALLETSEPQRSDITAKCNLVAVAVMGRDLGVDNDRELGDALDALAAAVRPHDAAVADALADNVNAAADWCAATGMTTGSAG